MKRFLLWIISVALGVVVLLAAAMGVSYAFTAEGGCPDGAAPVSYTHLDVYKRQTVLWELWAALCLCTALVLPPGSPWLHEPALLYPGLMLAAVVPAALAVWWLSLIHI